MTTDGDSACGHGTAWDVHCCGCHSGFLFDIMTCSCLTLPQKETMKIILQTRDGGFVGAAEIPPFHPPPEVVTWGSRVFVHELAHHAHIHRSASAQWVYVEGVAFPLAVTDQRNPESLPAQSETNWVGKPA